MSPIPPTSKSTETLLSRRISRTREVYGETQDSGERAGNAQEAILKIRGFQPLPCIAASPICTPTPSTINDVDPSETLTIAHLREASNAPTWFATPPSPSLHRSAAIGGVLPRQRSFTPSVTYNSFPASMQRPHAVSAHAFKAIKRSSSVPVLSSARFDLNHTIILSFMDAQIVQSPRAVMQDLVDLPFCGEGGPEVSAIKSAGLPTTQETNVLRVIDSGSPPGSSKNAPDNSWEFKKHNDTLRRFHALKELLSTEYSYLNDLRAFVSVYLRSLPAIGVRSVTSTSAFGRASASFTTGPWIYAAAQLPVPSATSSGEVQSSTSPTSSKSSRYVFTDHEVELLTRNAEDILRLHEHFAEELRLSLEPLGYAMNDDVHSGYQNLSNLDDAIRIVSTKFATEASRFNAYQTFCAGHLEATDVYRKASQQFPVQIEAFERRCSTTISETSDRLQPELPLRPSRSSTDGPSIPAQTLTAKAHDRKRAMSLTSLDSAAKALGASSNVHLAKDTVAFPTESTSTQDTKSLLLMSSHRIAFSDYLIKPVQRICKYPLLLDQLLPSKAIRALSVQNGGPADGSCRVDIIVESAAQAMRHVATSVDEARRKQDIAVQSGLILTRVCAGLPPASSSSSQVITSDFLTSLGTCLLSGSLDVMSYSPDRPLGFTSSIKAKYLGAFLYAGGFLIFVKAFKGKKYEPRHWFSLIDFTVVDVDNEVATLPCSIRLSCGDHHFEMAAACQREKDQWLTAIREAMKTAPSWDKEPTPSFMLDEKGDTLPPLSDDGHSEAYAGLPTIRSISEIDRTSDTETSEPLFASLRSHSRRKRQRYNSTASIVPTNLKQSGEGCSLPRRSSTASVKSIFGPITPSSDNETIVITRSSVVARQQIDQELQDIISPSCLTARNHASTHEMELFQVPTRPGHRTSRTNSTIGMARLSKHESVKVSRRRNTDATGVTISQHPSPVKAIGPKNVKRLKLNTSPPDCDASASSHETSLSLCPSPPSTHSSSSHASVLNTPVDAEPLVAETTRVSGSLDHHTKTRSFVRNVKGLFQLKQAHLTPTVPVVVGDPYSIDYPPAKSESQRGLLSRFGKSPLRSRSKSRHRDSDKPPSIFEDEPATLYPMGPIIRSAVHLPV